MSSDFIDVNVLFVPVGISSPPYKKARQIVYCASDAIIVNRSINGNRFVLQVQSSREDHQPLWQTQNEITKNAIPGTVNLSWNTVIAEARYQAPSWCVVRFPNNPSSLFIPTPGIAFQPNEYIYLHPIFPCVPCITAAELLELQAFQQRQQQQQQVSNLPAQFLRFQLIWQQDNQQQIYQADMSSPQNIRYIQAINPIEQQAMSNIHFGPVPNVNINTNSTQQQNTLAFPCYWIQFRLQLMLNNNNHPYLLNYKQFPFAVEEKDLNIAPRFDVYADLPPTIGSADIQNMNLITQSQMQSQLNRQRDISERAFYGSLEQKDRSNVDLLFLIPQMSCTVDRAPPRIPATLPPGTFRKQLRFLVTQCFLLNYTSSILELLRNIKQSKEFSENKLNNTDESATTIAIQPEWIRANAILSPSTELSSEINAIVDNTVSVPTSSIRSYIHILSLIFIATQLGYSGTSIQPMITDQYQSFVEGKGVQAQITLMDLYQIFVKAEQSFFMSIKPGRIPKVGEPKAPVFTQKDSSVITFYKIWYKLATYVPYYQLTSTWSHVDNIRNITSPILFLLAKQAFRLIEDKILDVKQPIPPDSNLISLWQDKTVENGEPLKWFNSVTYMFENNLYWESCNLYNLCLESSASI